MYLKYSTYAHHVGGMQYAYFDQQIIGDTQI